MLEIAAYHAAEDGGIATGGFLPNGADAITILLDPAEQARKQAMLDWFETQRATLAAFGTTHEAFRTAPRYDYTQPPHHGTLHYERYDWGMTGPRWRALREGCARVLTVLSVGYPLAAAGPDAVGGSEQVLSALDRALVAGGHRSIVIAPAGSVVAGELVATPPVPAEIDDRARARAQAALRDALSRVMREEGPDLIHLHGLDFADYLPPPGAPVLVTLHLPLDWYARDALLAGAAAHLVARRLRIPASHGTAGRPAAAAGAERRRRG